MEVLAEGTAPATHHVDIHMAVAAPQHEVAEETPVTDELVSQAMTRVPGETAERQSVYLITGVEVAAPAVEVTTGAIATTEHTVGLEARPPKPAIMEGAAVEVVEVEAETLGCGLAAVELTVLVVTTTKAEAAGLRRWRATAKVARYKTTL